MTQKNIKNFIKEIYSKPPKKNYITKKQTFITMMTFGV